MSGTSNNLIKSTYASVLDVPRILNESVKFQNAHDPNGINAQTNALDGREKDVPIADLVT